MFVRFMVVFIHLKMYGAKGNRKFVLGFDMALLKRRRRPKSLPARQIICGECGAVLLVEPVLGTLTQPYSCAICSTRDKFKWDAEKAMSQGR